MIARYKEHQDNVKNSREFDALSKEIEMQSLEIQLSEKKIREAQTAIENKNEFKEESKARLDDKKKDLEAKQKELEKITKETEKEEKALIKKSDKAKKGIEDRLVNAYTRIRNNYKNGMAVVKVERDSCGGCFSKIPPQRQMEIRQRKKIIVCENCGRILVDDTIDE